MNSVVITGVNRGLGLGLFKTFLRESDQTKHLIGTCRDLKKAEDLLLIADQNPHVRILELDVRRTETFEDFARKVEEIVQENGLNLLFNNAGYSPKSTRINVVTTEQLSETYSTNVIGPIMLTKALLPLLKKAASKSEKKFCPECAAVINMTSVLGSIGLNKEGGLFPYRCSKAALNMATKSLSVDLKTYGITVACLHPGWVKTDMGGSNAPLTVDESVSQIFTFIKNLNQKHNGGFYQYNGEELQW